MIKPKFLTAPLGPLFIFQPTYLGMYRFDVHLQVVSWISEIITGMKQIGPHYHPLSCLIGSWTRGSDIPIYQISKNQYTWKINPYIDILISKYRFQLRQYTNILISLSDIPIYKFQIASIPAFLPIYNIQISVVRGPIYLYNDLNDLI